MASHEILLMKEKSSWSRYSLQSFAHESKRIFTTIALANVLGKE
jgi:hypothetical protein